MAIDNLNHLIKEWIINQNAHEGTYNVQLFWALKVPMVYKGG